jgi:hypothetical protein
MPEQLPESRRSRSLELDLGSTETDHAAQINSIMKQNCNGLQQHIESVDANATVLGSDRRWVLESKFTTATVVDPNPSREIRQGRPGVEADSRA